jgi:hypothetical protein
LPFLPAAFSRPAPASHTALAPVTPEPTIEVTIGRLEVRAVMASAPPPRERTRATAPDGAGLEEYLRRRRRGDSA